VAGSAAAAADGMRLLGEETHDGGGGGAGSRNEVGGTVGLLELVPRSSRKKMQPTCPTASRCVLLDYPIAMDVFG